MLSVARFEVVSYCCEPGCPCHHKSGVVEAEYEGNEPGAVAEALQAFRRGGRYPYTVLRAIRWGREPQVRD
jgi:hypothetical protein